MPNKITLNQSSQLEILESILDSTDDNLMMISKDYKVLAFNKSMQNTIQVYFNKVIQVGDDYRDYVVDSLKEVFLNAFHKALSGEKIDTERETKSDNFSIWFRYQLRPVLGKSGKVLGVVMTATNIDEKKRMEMALYEEAQRLAAVIDNSPESIIILDDEHKIVRFNQTARNGSKDVTGKHLEVGKNFWEYVNPQLENSLRDTLINVQKGQFVHKEDFLQLDNGEIYWFDSKVFPVRINDKITGACMVTSRIEERKKTEQKIQQYVHELNLLNALNDIILKTNEESKLCSEISKCLVNTGGYQMAWFAFEPHDDDEEKEVLKKYGFGCSPYLDKLEIKLNKDEHKNGPTAKCFETRRVIVNNELSESKSFKPWLQLAREYNLQASIAIPVSIKQNKIAVLNIYSDNPFAFDSSEVNLLKRIAKNISLALSQLTIEKEKQKAMYDLNERIKELRTIYAVSNILNEEISFEIKLQRVVEIIPQGWQYPEYCSSKIIFDDNVYESSNWKDGNYQQSLLFRTSDQKNGVLTIAYDRAIQKITKNIFIQEELELLGSIMDQITLSYNRSLSDTELKNTQQNLLTVFNNSETGYLLLNSSLHVVSISSPFKQGYSDLIGYEVKIGDNFIELLQREKREKALISINESLETGNPVNFESSYTRNNETRHFQISIVPIFDDKDFFVGVCKAVQDITERKNQEEKLQQQKHDLEKSLLLNKRIIETSDLFFYIANVSDQSAQDFKINFCSPQVKKIFNRTAEEICKMNQGWVNFIYKRDRENYLSALNKLFQQKTPVNISYRLFDKENKTIKWVEDYLCPFTDENDNVVEIYGSLRDIDDRMQVLHALEQEQKKSNEHQSKLLSSQLNPHFIFNTLNAFQHSILHGKTEDSLNHIADFSKLMRLVLENSMSNFITLRQEILFLHQYVKLSSFRIKGSLKYEINIEDDLDEDEILIPPMLLQPYIENAIIHGFSTTKDEWKLVITISLDDNRIYCSVRDFGIGRGKSMENKLNAAHKSYAMNINQQRIELLNSFTDGEFQVEVIDHYDENNAPSGTEVILSYFELNEEF